jgi:quinoprotein glucose dehydrogenase
MSFRTVWASWLGASYFGAGCLAAWLVLSHSFIEPARSAEARAQEPAISSEAKLAAKAIQVPAGFTLRTVASEPNLANPVAFCFDPAGRIFVAETYRVGKGVEDDRHHMDWLDDDLAARTVDDRREYLKRHMGDQIQKFTEASEQVRLLEDRDADGIYEFSSIFSNDYKDIVDGAAAGVMWSNNRLLFTCIPTLWELRDADGDGKAEERRSLATGFGVHTAFYGHDLHGLCEGPDGKLYFSIGDRGLNVDTPNGVLSNPDSGAVLRCNPDGSQLERFATGLRNPQELAFNEFGDLFTVDNNSDSGDKARLVHIVEGMDAGWRMPFQYLSDRGPFNREKIWHTQNSDQPASIIPPLAHISDGPSGLVYYPGTGLPAEYNDSFLLVDFRGAAATSGIRQFSVEPHGATYRLKDDKPFITGVLATDCDFAPSGDLFILDWVEGWSGPGVGRVHRVTCDDAATNEQRSQTAIALNALPDASIKDLLALMGHPDMRVRLGAQKGLVAQGVKSIEPLKTLAADQRMHQLGRLHAIWALGELAEREPVLFDAVAKLCVDGDAEIRSQAARTLGRAADCDEERRAVCGKALVTLLADSSPRARCFAAIALGKLRHEPAISALLKLVAKDGNDPTLRHAIAMGLAGTQASEALVKAANNASDSARLVLVVALGKQKSPLVAHFLADTNERVVLEAARAIWDTPIPAANGHLAALIDNVPSTSDPLLRRVLAANVAGGTPQQLQAVIDVACRSDLSPSLRDLAWEQVRSWAAPSSRDSVNGDWRPLAPRSAADVAAALRDSLPKLVEVSKSDPLGLIVAAELGVEDAYVPLVTVVTNDALPEELRVRAVAAFGKANNDPLRAAIDVALASTTAGVRAAARTLWADRFPDQAVGHLSDTIDSGTTQEQQSAIDTLAGMRVPAAREIVSGWMKRLEDGNCPPELTVEILDAAVKSADSALIERQKQYVAKLASDGQASQFSFCLSGGDPQRGQKIFDTNDTLACRRCHSLKPDVVLVGPSLATVGAQRKPSEILESIVTPNAKICEGFDTAVLELDSGIVLTGVVRRETKDVIELVDVNAKPIIVDVASVESRVKGKSAMPDNVVEQMSLRELRDLVAYLSQLKAPATGGAAH